jgi:hypothetical protein
VCVDGHGRFGSDVRFESLETTEPCIGEKLRGEGGGGLRFCGVASDFTSQHGAGAGSR